MIVAPRAAKVSAQAATKLHAAYKIRLIGSSATFIGFLRDFGPYRACITHLYHAPGKATIF
jgi:hypothetical protein